MLLFPRDVLHEFVEVLLLGDIAGSNSGISSAKGPSGKPGKEAYGIIWPPSEGLCDLAAVSRTSMRRPVM